MVPPRGRGKSADGRSPPRSGGAPRPLPRTNSVDLGIKSGEDEAVAPISSRFPLSPGRTGAKQQPAKAAVFVCGLCVFSLLSHQAGPLPFTQIKSERIWFNLFEPERGQYHAHIRSRQRA